LFSGSLKYLLIAITWFKSIINLTFSFLSFEMRSKKLALNAALSISANELKDVIIRISNIFMVNF
jgi:hypothetical protein